MSNEVVRIGVIGTGDIADNWLIPALSQVPGAVFWSVLSRDAQKGEAFATKHNARAAKKVHTDLKDFLADDQLDAVIIATPDKLHAEQAIACARAGKHVFVEKPMATTSEDAQRIIDAVDVADVKLAVGYHLRFHAGHRLLAEKIESGELGEIRHVRIEWTYTAKPNDWRATAKAGKWWSLGAVGTHIFDLINWMLVPSCGYIQEIKTVQTNSVYKQHDETSLVSMRFLKGATAQVMTSVLFHAPRIIEIHGTKGTAICKETLGPRGTGTITINDQVLEFKPENPYAGELNDFVNAILNDEIPEANENEGLWNVNLLERATNS